VPRPVCRVTFQPEGRSVFVLAGTTLVEAAGRAGIILNQPCGGEGTCGKCRVELLSDAPPPGDHDCRLLGMEQLDAGWRLACQLSVDRDLLVSVPWEARFFEQVILAEGADASYPFRPNVRKVVVRVPGPSVHDQRCDLDRLRGAVASRGLQVDLSVLRSLPSALRQGDGAVTVVLEGRKVQGVQPGDTTATLFGVAFDIGTTSLVGALVDLADPTAHGQATLQARTNPQVHFGDDVVSRIAYAQSHADGLQKLQSRLVACLNEMILDLCQERGVDPDAVHEITAVGNTTMSHVLLGIDPSPIAQAPYVAVVRDAVDVRAREVGLDVNPCANLHVLPNIAGFVGSDTVGFALAAGLLRSERVQLGIDIGTNGEAIIGNRHGLVACSCAAGPAFEGARIHHGMRASEGAVSKVVVNDDIEVGVIGGGRASGICGSGLIDAVAELLGAGLIDEMGRIADPGSVPSHVPLSLRRAVVEHDGQPAVVIVPAEASRTGEPILLTQRDVREAQLAKAAVQAGIEVLIRESGVCLEEISRVLVAGGFGNFIRRSCAKRIGLLPPVSGEKIEFVGNAAATGARMALVYGDSREEAHRISRCSTYVELAGRADFQQRFADALVFAKPDGS
jgi:uncharacterized 2Fe-2S/4Fe-4S cluster protein (DUF4445 family)